MWLVFVVLETFFVHTRRNFLCRRADISKVREGNIFRKLARKLFRLLARDEIFPAEKTRGNQPACCAIHSTVRVTGG